MTSCCFTATRARRRRILIWRVHKRTFIVSGKRSLLARRGSDLRVAAPGQAKKVAMMGSLDHVKRRLIVHTSRTRHSADFIAHLEQLDRFFGPQPGRVTRPVVLVEDNGPIHVSKIARAALDARKHWLTVEWLPKYSPELNDIEVVWHDLKALIWPIRRSPMSKRLIAKSTRRSKP